MNLGAHTHLGGILNNLSNFFKKLILKYLQKDKRIDLLRKHLAQKREAAERAAREAEERENAAAGVNNSNGTCRYRDYIEKISTPNLMN